MVKDLRLLKRSTPAVCGFSEREVTVTTKNFPTAIKQLKSKGYNIVGTSFEKGFTRKIWFIRPGAL